MRYLIVFLDFVLISRLNISTIYSYWLKCICCFIVCTLPYSTVSIVKSRSIFFVVDLVYKKTDFLEAELDLEESELNEDLDEDEPNDEIECTDEIGDIISSVRKIMTRLARSKSLRYVLRKYTNLRSHLHFYCLLF